MNKVIVIGCDLHDATMRLKMAAGPGKSVTKSFATADVSSLIGWAKECATRHGASRIVFAYEASGQGFGAAGAAGAANFNRHAAQRFQS